MSLERYTPIIRCPEAGERIYLEDNGVMRAAVVDYSDGQYIEFVMEDDGSAWSMAATLPHSLKDATFNEKGFNRQLFVKVPQR